jgi:hypothetical protein
MDPCPGCREVRPEARYRCERRRVDAAPIIAPRWGAGCGDGSVTQPAGLGLGISDLWPGLPVRLSLVAGVDETGEGQSPLSSRVLVNRADVDDRTAQGAVIPQPRASPWVPGRSERCGLKGRDTVGHGQERRRHRDRMPRSTRNRAKPPTGRLAAKQPGRGGTLRRLMRHSK